MSIIATKVQTALDIAWDTIPYIECDLDNIKAMLPTLYPSQHEDVLSAEQRFKVGKGRLFTNGTGTGKTYVGLGIVKRFDAKGKKNILIVVPTESKAQDWIEDARDVELSLTMLESTTDFGTGITVTTYANFYQNIALELREWDLIVYDESHYLNQNSKGATTVYFNKHKKMANLPSAAKVKARDIVGNPPEYKPEDEFWKYRAEAWKFQMQHWVHEFHTKTKVVFLSATPFAYHKSIKYADGTLFDIEETIEDPPAKGGWNPPSQWDEFMMSHFGYQWKNSKLTMPDVGVDQSFMEREFFEKYKEQNVMSTRMLDVPYDYSREFLKLDSELGNFLDKGMNLWDDMYIQNRYPTLSQYAKRKYRYGYVDQLLEAIKAKAIIPRIREHLKLGRKIVIFHGYNNTVAEHPFKFEAKKLLKKDEMFHFAKLEREIKSFELEFTEYVDLDLNHLKNAREVLQKAFPDAVQINGTISSKKKRKQNERDFNKDYSGVDIVLAQTKACKEGISLHDVSGRKQRVYVNLSLPVAPTEAIQSEGRIYRSGVLSNAIYEYPTLHTNFEKIAFSDKIAERSRTAENLAMGNLARDLETSFKEGYINAENNPPGDYQGVKGKENDRKLNLSTEFEKAITYYFSRQKKNSQTKSFEGVDYFATPEPLGYKMVEWLKPQPNERGLEPSVGHGAIGRWFPKFCDNRFVEPSLELFSTMKLICDGEGIHNEFENYYIGNKFNYIAMNPPFGKGGKTAVEHIAKATGHLSDKKPQFDYDGSRLIAIMPCGPSADKHFDSFLNSKAFKNFNFTGEILLPDCTFKRAGTSVMTKIIKIEHINTGNEGFVSHDLRYLENAKEFFAEIEELEF